MAKKLRLTQLRSGVGRIKAQKATLRALGFHKMGRTVVHDDCASIRGMVEAVRHLIKIEQVDGEV